MKKTDNLSGLREGETATVLELLSCGDMRRRLQDIGLTPGSTVKCLKISPAGDPVAYLIRGCVIALRATDCVNILVHRGAKQAACHD